VKRSPIARQSKKREREGRAYARLSKAFKEANPVCWVKGPHCTTRTVDCHHRVLRSRWKAGYLEESNFVAACFRCHAYIHTHPEWATEQGWMASAPEVVR